MGNPRWSYDDTIREADRIMTHSIKADEDSSIEELELRLKSYDHDNEFYFNCGIACANIMNDITLNEGCDGINAAIGGITMFKKTIGVKDN